MSAEETRHVVQGFFADHAGYWLAENVEIHHLTRSQPCRGRAAVVNWLDAFYLRAFPDAVAEDLQTVIGDGIAAARWVFRGRHRGSLAGEEPSGVELCVATSVFYEIRGGEIISARLYCDPNAFAPVADASATARCAGQSPLVCPAPPRPSRVERLVTDAGNRPRSTT